MNRSRIAILLLTLALAAAGRAQEGEDLFAQDLQEARVHLSRGRLTKARLLLDELLLPPDPGDPPEDRVPPALARRARVLRAELARRRGHMAKALALVGEVLGQEARHRDALVMRGDVLLATGRYREARTAFATAGDQDPQDVEARFKRGLASWLTGARKEARETWRLIVVTGQRTALTRARDLLFLGHALGRLGLFREASDRFLEASKKDPADHRAAVALGELYFLVYGEVAGYTSGSKEFNRVLRPDKGDPGYVPALLGQLRIHLFNPFLGPGKIKKLLRRIYNRDPNQPDALALEARMLTGDRRYRESRRLLERALKRNPNHLEALAQRVALQWLQGKRAEAEATRKQLQGIHPGHPGPDLALGLQLIRHYRFPESIPFLERALKLDRENVEALEGLGKSLIYCGRGEEAKGHLERAESIQKGFVNAWRTNAIRLQTRVAKEYRSWKRGPFVFWMHPDDAPVMLYFLPKVYGRAMAGYRKRYGVNPKGPIHVEVYHEFGDFSVRTIGFTGFGALGACFGDMITAVSPAAVELKGRFCWAATAWHELAHTVTLDLSRRRIPRWYTEGLSVYEETVYNPNQARHLEDQLVSDLYNGTVPKVMRFDTSFRGPRVIYAYYLAGEAVKLLLATRDFPALVRMCRLYGQEKDTDKALQGAFGFGAEEFDRRFRARLRQQVAGLKIRPVPDADKRQQLAAELLTKPGDAGLRLENAWACYFAKRFVDAGAHLNRLFKSRPGHAEGELLRGLLALAGGNRKLARQSLAKAFAGGADSFRARLDMAALCAAAKDDAGAIRHLEAAHRCWPTCTDPARSPLVRLAAIYKRQKRPEREYEALTRYVAVAGDARPPRIQLAAYLGDKGRRAEQARYLLEALHIDPFDSVVLEQYALALQTLERREEAVAVLGAALEVAPDLEANAAARERKPAEKAAFRARIRAARAALLLDLGRKEEARREAGRAVSEAPDSPGGRRARGLLDK